MSSIVKIILKLASSLLTPAAVRTQYFVQLCFNSNLQLINDISSDLKKLLKYLNGTAIVAFLKIPFAPSASVFPDNLGLCLKDFKSLLLSIFALKLVVSSVEQNHKLPVVSE